jgi:hypothetical protein
VQCSAESQKNIIREFGNCLGKKIEETTWALSAGRVKNWNEGKPIHYNFLEGAKGRRGICNRKNVAVDRCCGPKEKNEGLTTGHVISR